jgi:uncharacterized protein YgbK (DUF1537 family)
MGAVPTTGETVGPGRTDEPRLLSDLLADLPPAADEAAVLPRLIQAVRATARTVIALDDDPAGGQTVHNTPVLLDWEVGDLAAILARRPPLFFLLTNTRGLPSAQAEWINDQIGHQLAYLHGDAGFVPLSRSDSALRGHYPAEMLALEHGLGGAHRFDGHLFVPALFEAGRFTVDDVHWSTLPDDGATTRVVPISATTAAHDPAFGYRTAHLPTWIEEKSRGRWLASQVHCISLEVVRAGSSAVCRHLLEVQGGAPVVVNAACYGDLAQFVLGLLSAEELGKRFLYRAAGSFLRLRAGLPTRPPLSAEQVYAACARARRSSAVHGLVVVGSPAAATTTQLNTLLHSRLVGPIQPIEVDVRAVLDGDDLQLGHKIDAALRADQLPVVYTTREMVGGVSVEDTAAIGRRVIAALLTATTELTTRPRFVVVKGSTTSHELARRGFGARRATVLGHIRGGVPVWRLESTPRQPLRFRDLPYVVFPGGVDGTDDLLNVVGQLSSQP